MPKNYTTNTLYISGMKETKDMKAQDLRIGNLILDEDGLVEVTRHTLGMIELLNTPGHYTKFKPIPLTEEWILKMGYKWKDNYKYYVKTYGNNKESIIDIKFVVMDMDYVPILKHVHQLQNLYFALTGEALTSFRKQ
tara:strand:+ start:496 stop:906 length:411 start_codon:yes stop_codon:yes gene_type:complete